ncbi:adenylate/guanylate cyclase domain-containing protein [Oscillatoria sp. FACHB-1407]|uniref:adenylate/guanylate cyclase domain-containing protein n=1 Tax=Oscillatoria sp. FACHB-1407 TaxID=2692847 RepID=UPI0018EF417F|nr:adenylate/guanylate cyclase domain-containing protein [Oscillatoria sp. FACHB-1407]
MWGDTVNTASRIQTSSEPGKIQVSASTDELLKTQFRFEPRGLIDLKGKGTLQTYWLHDKLEHV